MKPCSTLGNGGNFWIGVKMEAIYLIWNGKHYTKNRPTHPTGMLEQGTFTCNEQI